MNVYMTSSVQRKKLYKQRLEPFFLLGRNRLWRLSQDNFFRHSSTMYIKMNTTFFLARRTHKITTLIKLNLIKMRRLLRKNPETSQYFVL
jgi:hypothetical protein